MAVSSGTVGRAVGISYFTVSFGHSTASLTAGNAIDCPFVYRTFVVAASAGDDHWLLSGRLPVQSTCPATIFRATMSFCRHSESDASGRQVDQKPTNTGHWQPRSCRARGFGYVPSEMSVVVQVWTVAHHRRTTQHLRQLSLLHVHPEQTRQVRLEAVDNGGLGHVLLRRRSAVCRKPQCELVTMSEEGVCKPYLSYF